MMSSPPASGSTGGEAAVKPPERSPAQGQHRMLNAANVITIVRILLIPVFVAVLFSNVPHGDILAAVVFAVAALTDKLDGYLARSRDSVTALGKFLDPLADKLLVSAALIALVGLHRLAAWVAMVIIAREFAVSALRVVGVAQGVSIPAAPLAKLKTGSQVLAVLFLLVPLHHWRFYSATEDILIGIAILLTVVSGLTYFYNARDLLRVPGGQPR
jgi:CDP-diacylglycerol--glycerol-3-phosphate 3-phosphatidyltransferase